MAQVELLTHNMIFQSTNAKLHVSYKISYYYSFKLPKAKNIVIL